MKRILFIAALIAGIAFTEKANAQLSVSVNIGAQPVWGPVGYDHVDYYYLPDADAYYDVPGHVFVYLDGGAWVRRPALPPRYANFDFYHSYKVVVNDRDPWIRHDVYRTKYISYRGRHDQVVIRDSREPKYYEVKEHPMHAQYHPGPAGAAPHNTVVEHNRVEHKEGERPNGGNPKAGHPGGGHGDGGHKGGGEHGHGKE